MLSSRRFLWARLGPRVNKKEKGRTALKESHGYPQGRMWVVWSVVRARARKRRRVRTS